MNIYSLYVNIYPATAFYVRKKGPLPSKAVLEIFLLVEMRRIELLSENIATPTSPSAVCGRF